MLLPTLVKEEMDKAKRLQRELEKTVRTTDGPGDGNSETISDVNESGERRVRIFVSTVLSQSFWCAYP